MTKRNGNLRTDLPIALCSRLCLAQAASDMKRWIAVGSVAFLSVVGCDSTPEQIMTEGSSLVRTVVEHKVKDEETSGSHSMLCFDVGIIDYERGGYLCLPLSRIGLKDASEIREVRSSCDCVNGRIVEYLTTDRGHAPAIRIDFEGDSLPTSSGVQFSPSDPNSVKPLNLAVDIEIKLATDEIRRLSIEFLQSPITPIGRPL